MSKQPPDASNPGWIERFMAGTKPAEAAVPAFKSQSSLSERKADERTRLVREMTDAATDKRSAATARLKEARLGKEADDRAQAALDPPKKKAGPKAKS